MNKTTPQSPSTVPENAWTLCWLMFFATALSFLDRQVLSVLAPSIMVELGMTNTDYSHVVSAFTFSYMIMFSAGGWLVDRLGTRSGLALCLVVWSIASGSHGFAASTGGLIAGRLFLGLGEGGCFPASTKGACEWFPPKTRTVAIGIANGGAAFGAVIAPPLTVWSALHIGWRGTFFATAAVGIIWVLIWWFATRGMKAPTSSERTARPTTPYLQLLRNRNVWRVLGARFLFDPVFYFYMFWIPKYLSDERGFSIEQIGNSTWIPFLALGITSLLAGRISALLMGTKRGRGCPLLVAALITPVSGFVVFAPSAGWAIALMTVLMAAHGIWITNFLADIGDRFSSSVVASIVGLSGTVGGLAGTLASMFTGTVVDGFGYAPIFLLTSVLYPIAAAILLLGRRDHVSTEPA